MHPRWASGNKLRAFLEPLRDAGLAALEFELDSNDPLWPEFAPLMAECRQLGFELCFHAPYRPPHTIAGYAGAKHFQIQLDYRSMFDVAASLGPATIVVHGARSETEAMHWLMNDTFRFLQWALRGYPNLTFALENPHLQEGMSKVGSSDEQLVEILDKLDSPRLKICWDVGHYVHAGHTAPPASAWLEHVGHVHIHDLDPAGQDHLPFLYGRVLPEMWLPHLPRHFAGIVTLELNGQRCAFLWPDRIMPALISSVNAIRNALLLQGTTDGTHHQTGDLR